MRRATQSSRIRSIMVDKSEIRMSKSQTNPNQPKQNQTKTKQSQIEATLLGRY
jgi:hypothetical protein